VPRDWLGRNADDFVHLLKERGNAGPIKTTTMAAETTRGLILGVTHHVAAASGGRDAFIWTYIYRANVGERLLTMLLAICRADIVVMTDDERDLRATEQQLAKAWSTRDRLTVERILAREWSMTTPDGAIGSRAAVLGATFESNRQIVESMTIDDDGVTVMPFEGGAVVRGKTVATVVTGGNRQTTSVRFTDVCVRRDGAW